MLQTFSDKFGEVKENKPTGDLGEDAFLKMCQDLGLDAAKETESLDWDFNVCGKHVDVKVLRNNYGLRDGFLLNVRANQVTPFVDVFAFFIFNQQNGELSFVGALSKDEFLQRSTLKRAGETEKTGFVYHCDTYVIADNSLIPIEKIVNKREKIPMDSVTMTPLLAQNRVKVTPRWRQNDTTMTPLLGEKS